MKMRKCDNDDYMCRSHIVNFMFDSLLDTHTDARSLKQLWDTLKTKYIAENASSKNFSLSDFNNYKMVDPRSIMEQYN